MPSHRAVIYRDPYTGDETALTGPETAYYPEARLVEAAVAEGAESRPTASTTAVRRTDRKRMAERARFERSVCETKGAPLPL